MALISSESMTLMVNGTLQSEFLTMFWPMRFTYSVMTGSVMNLVLFSISIEYILPILISVSVEYQLPMPRPPMSRLPTALTSSMLPALILPISLPGATTLSGFTATLVAGVSPPTGVVPGAGSFWPVLSDAAAGSDAGGVVWAGVAAGCWAGAGAWAAGVSPPTGVVPGAGCAEGVVAAGVVEGSDWEVDCAHVVAVKASASAASAIAFIASACCRPENRAVISSPPDGRIAPAP